nr:hypothetical protein [Tanacetum cinerariifolium]
MDKSRRNNVVCNLVQRDVHIRPKVAAFSVVYDGVQRMDENGSSDIVLFQNALAEYQTRYGHPFTMKACWGILKNHPAWSEVEVPTYQRRNN